MLLFFFFFLMCFFLLNLLERIILENTKQQQTCTCMHDKTFGHTLCQKCRRNCNKKATTPHNNNSSSKYETNKQKCTTHVPILSVNIDDTRSAKTSLIIVAVYRCHQFSDDDDELMLNVLRCQLTYQGQDVTNAEPRFNNSLRPRKREGSLGRTAQDGHHDSHTAPEL